MNAPDPITRAYSAWLVNTEFERYGPTDPREVSEQAFRCGWIAALERIAGTLYRSIYARHAAGCCLHVVLDDLNVDDDTIAYVAENVDPAHHDCRALAAWLRDIECADKQEREDARRYTIMSWEESA